MTFLLRLILAALLPLAACAGPMKALPHAPVEQRPEPLPAGVTPLTVEQEEEN
jgi:hypothetical protein